MLAFFWVHERKDLDKYKTVRFERDSKDQSNVFFTLSPLGRSLGCNGTVLE